MTSLLLSLFPIAAWLLAGYIVGYLLAPRVVSMLSRAITPFVWIMLFAIGYRFGQQLSVMHQVLLILQTALLYSVGITLLCSLALLVLVAMAVIGASVLAWLWKHLDGFYRVAVGAYVLAIVAMCAFAIAASAASGNWLLAGGAIAFAVSDISVARDRFVAHRFINRLWGLPLYYVAQVILALSIQHVAAAAA